MKCLGTLLPAEGKTWFGLPQESRRRMENVQGQEDDEAGGGNHHVAIEGQRLPKLAVEKCHQRASAAARRTSGEMEKVPPNAQIGAARQKTGRNCAA